MFCFYRQHKKKFAASCLLGVISGIFIAHLLSANDCCKGGYENKQENLIKEAYDLIRRIDEQFKALEDKKWREATKCSVKSRMNKLDNM